MKKILFATDFSENATKAFPFALEIASKHNAELIMLHVFDIPTGWNYPENEDAVAMERRAIRESEEKLKQAFEQKPSEVRVKFLAMENTSVVHGIENVISEEKPELLVIGTRGESKIKELLVGSTTKRVMKKLTIPILAIPNHAAARKLSTIIYASDLDEVDIMAINKMVEMLKPFDPGFTVVHISHPDELIHNEKINWFKNLLDEHIAYKKINFKLLVANNFYDRLDTFIKEKDAGLLVMMEKEQKGIFNKIFHQDLVNFMEFYITTPLMTFSEQALLGPISTEN